MTPLRQQMIAALQLSGKGERTQQAYVREVRLLAQFYGKSPDLLSEPELQHYFLHRKNVDGLAPASMRLCYSGIRFFYQHVLKRDWHTLSLIRAQTAHRLPAVLSVEEVRRLLKAATPLHNQVYFTTVYSLGLRLHEALYLQVTDIDGQRLQVHVHCPKRPSRYSAPTGKPTATTPGSFPPLGAIKNKALRRPTPCVAPVSKAPSAKPNNVLGSPKPASPSIPCGIPTPPICSKRVSIPGSSSAPWDIPNSKPP